MASKSKEAVTVIGVMGALGSVAWYLHGGGPTEPIDSAIEQRVAADAIREYEIVKRNGSATDKCVRAGLVAEAFLQAKDEPGYQTWKSTEKEDCAAAESDPDPGH